MAVVSTVLIRCLIAFAQVDLHPAHNHVAASLFNLTLDYSQWSLSNPYPPGSFVPRSPNKFLALVSYRRPEE
ncbi:hypothetical protein DFH06DRAFT_606413 [Mycena polygramma]|nr:hypothetical protein DFH06DRAFT_606413 [Mycena polygramma]